jgi:hypothetical protein
LLNAFEHEGKLGSRRVFLTCLGGGVFGNSMSWIMQAMRRAFEQFKECDLDIRIVTYAGPVDSKLLAIEQEFAACIGRAHEKKRARDEDMCDEGFTWPLAGQETPSGRKNDREADTFPESPPKYSAPSVKRPNKKGRTADKTAPAPMIDATVLQEAEDLGYAGALRNLAARPEIMTSGVTARVMLEALKSSGGLVNPAKREILGV